MKAAICLTVFCLGVMGIGRADGAQLSDEERTIRDRLILESFVGRLESSQGTIEGDELTQIYEEYKNLLYAKKTSVARKALTFFQEKKGAFVIAEGLLRGNANLRAEHVEALFVLNEKSVIPQLIKSLEENNYVQTGSEEVTIHVILKKKLVETLASLTGEHYKASDVNNSEEIREVIAKAKEWWEKNKGI